LSEPLHWSTLVTRLVEVVVNVPLPGGHGPRAHCRVTVVVDPTVPPLIVFTTCTVQVIAVVAPLALGPMPLHWLMPIAAAWAGRDDSASMASRAAQRRAKQEDNERTTVRGEAMGRRSRSVRTWRVTSNESRRRMGRCDGRLGGGENVIPVRRNEGGIDACVAQLKAYALLLPTRYVGQVSPDEGGVSRDRPSG
jgi:hypothetical protein